MTNPLRERGDYKKEGAIMKSPREVLEELVYELGYNPNSTIRHMAQIDQALHDLAEIVRGKKKNLVNISGGIDCNGCPDPEACQRCIHWQDYNQALTDITALFEGEIIKQKGEI